MGEEVVSTESKLFNKSTNTLSKAKDPECKNCHRVSRWLNEQVFPTDIMRLDVEATTQLYHLYSLRAMPTIYLLDKGNQVVLKDCSPEMLLAKLHDIIQ